MKDWVYASVEFGSNTIKLLVSEFYEGKQVILFIDEYATHGMRSGLIVDKPKVIHGLKVLIGKAERFIKAKITSLVIMLPSVDLTTKEVNYDLTIPENRVQGKHIKNLFNKVYQEENNDPDREIAFIYPRRFLSSNTRKSMYNPINENTRDLFVSLEVIYEDRKTMVDFVDVIDKCGLEVIDIMPSVVAYKNALLTREEMKDYACVVDIGHEATTITVYHDQLTHSSVSFKIGGQRATQKVMDQFKLSESDAENFKLIHGRVLSKEASDEIVYEQNHSDGSITYISSAFVSSMMDEAYIEIIRVIRQYLLENGLKNKIKTYYLIGGAVEMEGFDTLFKHNFGQHVEIRRPSLIGARLAKYSTIVSGQKNLNYLEQLFEENYQMIKQQNDEVE